jgi:hypothetical protein
MMLHGIQQRDGEKLRVGRRDGHVRDFYFDDKTWIVRYLVERHFDHFWLFEHSAAFGRFRSRDFDQRGFNARPF